MVQLYGGVFDGEYFLNCKDDSEIIIIRSTVSAKYDEEICYLDISEDPFRKEFTYVYGINIDPDKPFGSGLLLDYESLEKYGLDTKIKFSLEEYLTNKEVVNGN